MIVIGTRGSDLALTQSRHVAAMLATAGVETRLEIIRTKGDKLQHLSFDKIEGKGFFTKEIEDALLAGDIDLAVHSLKDLPGQDTPGLSIAAIPARQDVRDCLLVRRDRYNPQAAVLPVASGARVGTSAVRRKTQIQTLRPDVHALDLRGNVPTRVNRLREGSYDAIVLAMAGLNRLQLDLSEFEQVILDPHIFVPAPGQGALALQTRRDDLTTRRAVSPLHDAAAAEGVAAERNLLVKLNAGCHTPLGAHAVRHGDVIKLHVFFGADARAFEVQGADAEAVAESAYRRLQTP